MSTNDQDPKAPETTVAPERDKARRRLLKTLAAGGVAGAALPTQWTKPVIEAVVLPAHAQATSGTVTGGGGGGGTSGPGPAASVGESILNFFVTPAHASSCVASGAGYCIEIRVTYVGNTPTAVAVTKVKHPCTKSGLMTVFSGTQALSGSGSNWSGNVSTPAPRMVQLTSVNPTSPTLALCSYDGIPGTILNGTTCPADACSGVDFCSS